MDSQVNHELRLNKASSKVQYSYVNRIHDCSLKKTTKRINFTTEKDKVEYVIF